MTYTELQRKQLARAYRAFPAHIRAVTAGDRVTLASLAQRGVLTRRPWRGDGISRDSAFEYQLHPDVHAGTRKLLAEKKEKTSE